MRFTPTLFLVALGLTAAAAVPGRAADPETRCQKGTAKALSACVQKVSKAETACFKKTGSACAPADGKLAKALAKVEKQVGKQCADAASVAAAGYAPLEPEELVARFQAACVREIDDLSARVFGGPEGALLAAASDPDTKCLLAASKEAGKLLGKALKTTGKCAGKDCDAADLDAVDAGVEKLRSKTAAKLAKKCVDLAGLIGLDPATLALETTARVSTSAAAPCDPLDEGHCLFPMTNDYFTVGDVGSPTGRRLAFVSEAMPENTSGVPIDPSKLRVLDGFSVGPMLVIQDEQVDLGASGVTPITDIAASLDPAAPAVLVDAETGEQQLFWMERDVRGATAAEQAIVGRVATNLENGHHYIAFLRGLEDGAGGAIAPSPIFAAYRDRTATRQLPVEARRPQMERLFETLAGFGIDRQSLQLAWEFTTQSTESTASKLLAMRDDAFAVLGGAAPDFTVDTIDEPFTAEIFRRIDGTFQVPLYLTDGGVPGSELRLGADGLPENQGDFFTANYRCLVPLAATTGGAAPAVPARPTLYGHGLLGTKNETSSSHVRAFSSEHNFVVCGTDWTGFSEEDLPTVGNVLFDFSNFPRFIERQHQGVLNFMVLGELLLRADGFASDAAFQVGGESVIDPNALFYDGNSQGGILGGVLAAVAPNIERFVLGVPGINYSMLLNRSVDFLQFEGLLSGNYPGALDKIALIAVSQILWDQTDSNGHVRHTLSDPYPNTPVKKILYQVAFGDHQVAPFTAEIAARSNGAFIHTPILEPGKVVPELEPYYDIPAIPAYPFDGSAIVIWDSGNPAPPTDNVPPIPIEPTDPEWADLLPCAQNFDSDPHECPRRQPEARVQKSEFLKDGGAVVDVCAGAPCLAPAF